MRTIIYLLNRLGTDEKALYEKFCSVYNPLITVRNEDGLFICRGWTNDMEIVTTSYESELRKYFSLKEGIVIDVGAHIGKYTVMIGKGLCEGKIVSIEADPENFEILKENIALNNLKNTIALNLPAFRENGEITFYRTLPSNTGKYSIYSSEWNTGAIIVKAGKLDEILADLELKRIDLIKIDVEGAEYDVMLGATNLLKNTKMVIYEAIWGEKSEKCKELLTKIGFEIEDLGDNIVATNKCWWSL